MPPYPITCDHQQTLIGFVDVISSSMNVADSFSSEVFCRDVVNAEKTLSLARAQRITDNDLIHAALRRLFTFGTGF